MVERTGFWTISRPMLIALDYDGTYTVDPGLWHSFIVASRARGHRIFVVTMRFPSEGLELEQRLGQHVDRIIFTAREAKRRHVERLGHDVDVWIDNQPSTSTATRRRPLAGVRRSARWGAVAGRIFRYLWPERPRRRAVAPARTGPRRALPNRSAKRSRAMASGVPSVLVMVYGFKIWSESQGRYRVSKYKAPREVLARYDVEIMDGTGEVVARSELDGKKRYLSDENRFTESSFRSSSFDLQSGLRVIEEPHGAPGADDVAGSDAKTRATAFELSPRPAATQTARRRQPRQNCGCRAPAPAAARCGRAACPSVQTQVWKSLSDRS
jgi:hypothetical protein